MLKLEDSRKLIYLKYKNRIKRIHETEEHGDWVHFFTTQMGQAPQAAHDSLQRSSLYSYDYKSFSSTPSIDLDHPEGPSDEKIEASLSTNWGILNTLMLDKIKLAEKSVSDIKERVIQEFNSFSNTIRTSSAAYSKRRELLLAEYKLSLVEKQKNLEEL